MLAACSSKVSVSGGVDAEEYVEALCEELCAKYDECSPDPDVFDECAADGCFDAFMAEIDEPCFEERVELKRCWMERESCGEYFDLLLDTRPGSICYELVVSATACVEQNGHGR